MSLNNKTSTTQEELSLTQDMFYSYFLTRCSEYRIRKPNRWVLDMLENFNDEEEDKEQEDLSESKTTHNKEEQKVDDAKHIAADSSARTVDQSVLTQTQNAKKNILSSVNNNNNNATNVANTSILEHSVAGPRDEQQQQNQQQGNQHFEIEVEPVPLEERKKTRIIETQKQSRSNTRLYPPVERIPFHEKTEFIVPPTVILGNTTLSILIEMFYFMPQLEVVDLSNCRLYDVDPQRVAPSGNDILKALFTWVAVHPAIAHVILGRRGPNQIGTEVGSWMIHAAMENPRLIAIEFDERGIEKHILDDVYRTLKINRNAQSPISTAIRSIHAISSELLQRMASMKEIGAIDRKTSDERQLLLSLMYDHPKLFLPMLDSDSPSSSSTTTPSSSQGSITQSFVAPAKQYLLSEGLTPALQGVRGDGKNLFIIASGTVTIRLGRYDVTLQRGDIFGEKIGEDVLFASGVIVRRSANGCFFAAPHSVCQSLFSSWEKRVDRFLPLLKNCPILNALPVYILARCCYDAELVSFSSSSTHSNNRLTVVKAGDAFSGFYIVVKGLFRVYRHQHVAKFMQSRESAQTMKEGGILDFDEGSLFGEESIVNRRQSSTVDIDCVVLETNNTNSAEEEQAFEWQVLQLDAKFCSTVLKPLLQTVLLLQARSYGSEWYNMNNNDNKDERTVDVESVNVDQV